MKLSDIKENVYNFFSVKLVKSFKSIRTYILFSFSLLIIIALFIFLFLSLNYTKQAIIRNSTDYTSQLVRQVNSDIDSYIQYMKNISIMITRNSDVSEYLFNDDENESEKEIRKNAIIEQLNTLKNSQTDIRNIGIYRSDDLYLFNDGKDTLNPHIELEKLDWYKETVSSRKVTYLSSSHVQTLINNKYTWVITLGNQLTNPYTNNADGFVFIDLNYHKIRELCDNINLGKQGYLFIIDENGNLIYHPKQQLLYSSLKTECIDKITSLPPSENSFITTVDGSKKLYTVSTSRKTNWTVVGVADLNELNHMQKQTQIIYILTALLLFIIAFLISGILSQKITEPIRQLQASMSKVEQGEFETAIVPETEQKNMNEIGSLRHSFNIMALKIQSLIDTNTEVQRQKRKSELKALQSQIKPHFLYNTLDSIIWMAETGENKKVVLMTSALAKLFRQSISNDDEIVTISQEIEYVKSYLTIQKMRYKDTMDYHINIEENILNYQIVKLIIQPLVENAIYHGLKYKDSPGNLWIDGYKENDDIYIVVSDDGVGMDEETLEHIFDDKPHSKNSTGVGINNIQNRLHLYYAPEYGLTFESEKDHGTTVYIHIPATTRRTQ